MGGGDGDKGRTELFATNLLPSSQSVTKMTNVCNWSVFKVSVSLLNGKKKRERFCCVILEFVMMEIKMILSESFNLASSSDGLPVMKLLTALFSLCECCTYLNA